MFRRQATALVRGFVFPDDRGRNATALTYLVAAIPCPCPYLRTALTARARARLAPTAASAGLTRVICVSADLVMQFLGVCGAQIDLEGGSVNGERNCLLALDLAIVGKVTDDRHHCPLSHESQPFRWSKSDRNPTRLNS